jgi:hypothetical protein
VVLRTCDSFGWAGAHTLCSAGNATNEMYVAELEPQYRERRLVYAESGKVEKNWVPFVAHGQLYMSYSVCPHVVLHCVADLARPDGGHCSRAYSTEHSACGDAELRGLRGGSPAVRVGAQLVGIAHRSWERRMAQPLDDSDVASATAAASPADGRTSGGGKARLLPKGIFSLERSDRYYVHHVYTTDPSPPFALRHVGPPFRFPRFFGGTDRDAVQFCAGLALGANRSELLVSYGVADCVSMSLVRPTSDVFGVDLPRLEEKRRRALRKKH